MTKFIPLGDRALVERIEQEDSKGNIIIPDVAKEKPSRGKILAVGSGKFLEDGTRRPLDAKVGDQILFGKFSGQEITLDNKTLLVMREEEILGVVEQN